MAVTEAPPCFRLTRAIGCGIPPNLRFTMSRIIQFSTTGGPEVLTYKDVNVAEPAAGEVRIRVKAIGLNRAESMWRAGEYIEEVKLPARLGYEAAGIVDAVGPGVTR